MEHLIYHPSPRTFRAEIRDGASSPLEVTDWTLRDRLYGSCAAVSPRIPWLGHDHCGSSYLHSVDYKPMPIDIAFRDEYGRDWNIEEMLDHQDIYCAHSSLKELDVHEAVYSTAAFIQAWQYFGLLEAIFATPIYHSYLTRFSPDEDGKEWIYSRNLGTLLELWKRRLDGIEDDFRETTLRQARDCVTVASTILHDIVTQLPTSADSEKTEALFELRKLIVEIEPALSALHEAIAGFVERELRMEIKSFSGFSADTAPFPRKYSERLVAKGWCSFVIASAEIAMSPSLLRYVDAADFAAPTTGHKTCTAARCQRNDVELSTYKQEHETPECNCHFLKPSLKDVFDIFNAHKIPVVQFIQDGGSLRLGAVDPHDSKADYVAFSHVWADGLGSSTELGLPACQIARLHQLASQRLTYDAYFWIDGLCVPSKEPYRGKAIELMKATYANATGVIVVDKGMRSLSVSAPSLEIGWTVFASGWFGRLWTYQEGFLPAWVDLELKDGLFDLYGLIQGLYRLYYDSNVSPFPTVFVRDLLAVLQKARPLDRQAKHRPKVRKLVDIFNAFTRRRTSRPDDQLLVMGLLLDVDVRDLMELNGQERWIHFYLSLREIPWTVLFDKRPKIECRPFRWAPASWISPGQDVWLHYDEGLGMISKDGLSVTLTVLSLDEAHDTSMSALVLEVGQAPDQTKARYELSRPDPGSRVSSSSRRMDTFNLVFIRHFAHESPQKNLMENSRLLMSVGLGYFDHATGSSLVDSYDFSSPWEVRFVIEEDADFLEGVERVRAKWMAREFCFT
ncbi:uncharacterized protein Z518_08512 [Rhinocladiella mackenziei CBS 650.93]|uniref:Rhinocladiella mackenziei CBS 650.93 unplaced genomic scaffold supercont1.6, whole genome shotgun sequence n=1 Tax=Rhinocladiella mackenziei CBS 650.93 TaxID=1442369 RepID=A0A0D2IH03_9EURO|nr:uncharacterized protein Z518_08512 [Rhinocladiella mackenziei CBS 650.93]KIX02571.1 hypothetical protein Z518_08512 [Rhinocladiella mackenziei CBS 650.93]